jgi:hypothetical protein
LTSPLPADVGSPCRPGLDHVEHLRHELGGARLMVGRCTPSASAVLVHGVDEALGQRREWFAVLGGALDDLVVDVGDVAHVGDMPAAPAASGCTMSNTTSTRAWPRWQ